MAEEICYGSEGDKDGKTLTVKCPYGDDGVKVGSGVCNMCSSHVDCHTKEGKKFVTCTFKSGMEQMVNNLQILKSCIKCLDSAEKKKVLMQVIDSIDNPLGVVAGDKIVVWNTEGGRREISKFIYYSNTIKGSWHVKGNKAWDYARVYTGPPKIEDRDVEFLYALSSNVPEDTGKSIIRILEGE